MRLERNGATGRFGPAWVFALMLFEDMVKVLQADET
jgi:hypothetical protein